MNTALENDVAVTEKKTAASDADSGTVSVIVSVRDFESGIQQMYNELSVTLESVERDYELVFVEDGSLDKTWPILTAIEKADPKVKLIKMRSKFGESAALDAGIKHSRGETVIYLAARVRIAPKDVLSLLKKVDAGHDMVIGWRHPRRDSWLNRTVSKQFNWITRKISKMPLHDFNSGVLAARRGCLNDVPVYGAFNHFLPMLADRQGYKVTETQVEQQKGDFRQSRYFNEYLQRMLDILTVIFMTKYSKKPIHFLGFLGSLFTIFGLGCNAYLFIYRILQLGPIGGRPLLLLGALFLVIGLQLISIGLLGEMIIFTHAGEIKEYNIEMILE